VKFFEKIFLSTFSDRPRFGDARHEWVGENPFVLFS
jgi:hypothetical protein